MMKKTGQEPDRRDKGKQTFNVRCSGRQRRSAAMTSWTGACLSQPPVGRHLCCVTPHKPSSSRWRDCQQQPKKISPVEPPIKNAISMNHDQRPSNGGDEGLSHSFAAPHAARSANPARKRTNHRVSSSVDAAFKKRHGGPSRRRDRCRARLRSLHAGSGRKLGVWW